MKNAELEKELHKFAESKRNEPVPVSFTTGLEQTLASLPDHPASVKQPLEKRKYRWLQVASASVILAGGIIGSGFASPAMAQVLTKVPGLSFIFSASYDDLSKKEPEEHKLSGSQFGFGEEGPFNAENVEVKTFKGYTKELHSYLGFSVPQLPNTHYVKVDKYGDHQFEINAFGEINHERVILNVVPNAINLPQFEGGSMEPIIKESIDINGVSADILTYKFTDNSMTNYIVWKKNDMVLILASALPLERLIEASREVDSQIEK